MSNIYPAKLIPLDFFPWGFIVRVEPQNLVNTYDRLWMSFTNGYTGQQVNSLSLLQLRDRYSWAGYVKKLITHLDKALDFYGYNIETQTFLNDVSTLIVNAVDIPIGIGEFDTLIRPSYTLAHQEIIRQLGEFISLLGFLYRRLGRYEWRTDSLAALVDPQYEAVLYRVGEFINQAEMAKIFDR